MVDLTFILTSHLSYYYNYPCVNIYIYSVYIGNFKYAVKNSNGNFQFEL